MIVAAEHAEGESERTGKGVEERFLLDRIDLDGTDISVRNPEFVPVVESDPTDAGRAGMDLAAVGAGQTGETTVIAGFPQFSRNGKSSQSFFKGDRTITII